MATKIKSSNIIDDAISEEHLDVTAITGHTTLSASAASDDVLLIYDTSSGQIKKIQANNVGLLGPSVTSISPTNVLTGDGSGNHTFVVTGTRFDSTATAKLKKTGGADLAFSSVTRNSSTQLTCVIAKSAMLNADEPFDVVVTTENGLLSGTLADQVTVDASPAYVTSAGSLGTITGGSAMTTIDVVASDPESAGNVTYEIQSGSLPTGVATATVHENGVSKFRITGTPTNPVANTTSNFTLRAVDAASNTTSRAFSITVSRTFTQQSFTSSGTFSVPAGVTSLDAVMVVAAGGGGAGYMGGGGGAGGLIYMPEYPVTASGTVTVTVGCGGGAGPGSGGDGQTGQDSAFGSPGDPGLGQGGVLTTKGGGGGAYGNNGAGTGPGKPGGSGGGTGGRNSAGDAGTGGCGTQPTQPGNSGAYGFGNDGGDLSSSDSVQAMGGGGGGAGAVGNNGAFHAPGRGNGGVGKAYSIADGTTPVTYAGGGGAGHGFGPTCYPSFGKGISGGGGDGADANNGNQAAQPGQANRGGGGGGGGESPSNAAGGGKGVVIVRY